MPTLELILQKYPIKNSAWYATENGAVIVSYASDLGLKAGESPGYDMFTGLMNGHLLDPWNRRFPHATGTTKDSDGDISLWTMETSVEGMRIVCKIFND